MSLTAAPDLPIIILTKLAEEALASQAVQNGAQEYLVKEELTSVLLLRAIRSAIGRRRSESERYFAASRDPLTRLPNRLLFQDRLAHTLERARRDQIKKNAKWKVAVLLLDLDHFRSVNDQLGHVEGSFLLQNVADRLRNCFRKVDTIARTGSDEFTLLFESLESNEEAIQLAKKVQLVFQKPFLLNDQAIMVTVEHRHRDIPRSGGGRRVLVAEYRSGHAPGPALWQLLLLLHPMGVVRGDRIPSIRMPHVNFNNLIER